MAEIAGLVLGSLGIAGLFKACVENFDIIIRARECSEELELLCTVVSRSSVRLEFTRSSLWLQLSLQQLRLVIWGEALGLVPQNDGHRGRYNRALDRPDIRPVIERKIVGRTNHGYAPQGEDDGELRDGFPYLERYQGGPEGLNTHVSACTWDETIGRLMVAEAESGLVRVYDFASAPKFGKRTRSRVRSTLD